MATALKNSFRAKFWVSSSHPGICSAIVPGTFSMRSN